MRVVGYVRVSTEEQASSGVSLDVQRNAVELYCQLHKLELVGIEADEGVSAKNLIRPALRRALEMLRDRRADGLVVTKLDRLSRSIGDWATLIDEYFGEKGGKRLLSVSDSIDTRSAAGRLVLNILMSVAQGQRETISENVAEAMAHVKAKGDRAGQIPFGRRLVNPSDRDDTRMEDDPAEQGVLLLMQSYRDAGLSLRAIASLLTSSRVPTKHGLKPWQASSVRAILKRTPHAPRQDVVA